MSKRKICICRCHGKIKPKSDNHSPCAFCKNGRFFKEVEEE